MERSLKFTKLPSAGFLEIDLNSDVSEMYLDSLALMDDLLCEFVPDREPPRQNNADSVIDSIKKIQKTISGHTADEVEKNIAENFEIAKTLRNEALKGSDVKKLIKDFLANLLQQYMWIAQGY